MTDEVAPPARRLPRPWLAAGLIALALGAAVGLGPRLFRLDRSLAAWQQQLTAASGWQVELGSASLSLWNGTVLTIAPTTLRSPTGRSTLTIEATTIESSWRALLRGVLEPRVVTFVRPIWNVTAGAAPDEQPSLDRRALASLDELRVRGGRLIWRGGFVSGDKPFELSEINALVAPSTGRVWGQARLGVGSGRLSWQGTLQSGATFDIERADMETVHSWLGGEWLGSVGTVDARVTTRDWRQVEATLRFHGAEFLPARWSLPELELALANGSLGPASAGKPPEITVRTGGLECRAIGPFSAPQPLVGRCRSSGSEAWLDTLRRLTPLPAGVRGPAQLDLAFTTATGEERAGATSLDGSFNATVRGAPVAATFNLSLAFAAKPVTARGRLELSFGKVVLPRARGGQAIAFQRAYMNLDWNDSHPVIVSASAEGSTLRAAGNGQLDNRRRAIDLPLALSWPTADEVNRLARPRHARIIGSWDEPRIDIEDPQGDQ